MYMKTIYNLENRGSPIIGHFLFYMIAGISDIENKTIVNIGPDSDKRTSSDSYVINWNVDIREINKINIEYPLLIHYTGERCQFHNELFDIVKDKITLINDINQFKNSDYRIINNYGVPTTNSFPFISPKYIHYIRKLILDRVNKPYDINNKFYISRNKSMTCANSPSQLYGKPRRSVINEEQLLKVLEPLGFKKVYMEDLSMKEKIELFNSANTIVGPFGGGFSCSLFANQKTKIIELLPTNPTQFCDQFKDICSVLNIKFTRFSNLIKDENDNMLINIDELVKIL